ncbi:DUF1837 domain-containing protein [Agromyces sp. SYSU K20354]|uniref:HamA C-terminal domain-containing protein n=1 Tax=Agromyces cavernae TaxID=2898659 RepID=UPI001E51BD64|nr:DUF1837 domain-containing protein [Agromyces cavernae]MCD2443068.1 DUF1837 domain-containing protein [Agromyces cavernae]
MDDQSASAIRWAQELAAVARPGPDGIGNYLITVGEAKVLENTRTRLHTHWIAFDGNGRPRVDALAKRLSELVLDYCIPRTRIQEAQDYFIETQSTSKLVALHNEALSRFTRLEKSGEGGELLLYFLMEIGLKLPQVLSKMALKTDSQMHFNGADGVHLGPGRNGNLAVYWGEAKVYDSFDGAARDCMAGISGFLLDEGFGNLQEDLLLVRDHLDIGSRELSLRLVKYFTEGEKERLHLEARGACLIAYTHDDYQHPLDPDDMSVLASTVTQMTNWAESIGKKIKNKEIAQFDLEVFCVPMPSSAKFRESIRLALKIDGR